MTDVDAFLAKNLDQRTQQFFNDVKANGELFILTDDDGCVMLTTDEEDGVPVWSSATLATLWATDEWAHCVPKAISVETWKTRWTSGLNGDMLVVMVAPVPGEDGDVIMPDEFDAKL